MREISVKKSYNRTASTACASTCFPCFHSVFDVLWFDTTSDEGHTASDNSKK